MHAYMVVITIVYYARVIFIENTVWCVYRIPTYPVVLVEMYFMHTLHTGSGGSEIRKRGRMFTRIINYCTHCGCRAPILVPSFRRHHEVRTSAVISSLSNTPTPRYRISAIVHPLRHRFIVLQSVGLSRPSVRGYIRECGSLPFIALQPQ